PLPHRRDRGRSAAIGSHVATLGRRDRTTRRIGNPRPGPVARPMTRYFAHITAAGPVRSDQVPFAIGRHDAPHNFMPIGMAWGTGRAEEGLERWKLGVHGVEVPGRWVIVDREFRPVEG